MSGPHGSTDPLYDTPYTDIDEWRDEPVRHRYVHGGFEGTDCRFSCYFPPEQRYEGRFFQPLMPVSGFENAAPAMLGVMMGRSIPFAGASGGYLVESNLGRTVMFPGDDVTIPTYRASAAVAKYARVLAAQMYGEHRPYGYVYGGSGGAFKTISCMENAPGVWDGAVPFVQGSPVSLPHVFTVQAHAMRVLWDKLPRIIDAIEPGGSGDMYDGLTVEERGALAEVTAMGFPPRAWFNYERIALGYTGVFTSILDQIIKYDPRYFSDFWTEPGYLGADSPESLAKARVRHKTVITRVIRSSEAAAMGLMVSMSARLADSDVDGPAAVQLASLPDNGLQGATIAVTSGAAAGHQLHIAGAAGDLIMIGFGEQHFRAITGIAEGDEVLLDNDAYLAAQTYHRHQVTPDFGVFDQFVIDGAPIYPQRPALVAPRFARSATGGDPQTGRFAGKMIVVQALMDEAAYPWQADWYRARVRDVLDDRLDDRYRLWFVDHAMHTSPTVAPGDARPVRTTRAISYEGVLQQALRDVSAWVEHGIAPPPSTDYDVVDGQVHVPATATARRGIQPTVTVTANGATRAEVTAGEAVEFTGAIEVPAGTGTIVGAEWDFEGSGEFPVAESFDDTNSSYSQLTVSASHRFTEPGTYFPALRVSAHRQGDYVTAFGRVQNLGRVRVVVHQSE